MGNIFVLFFILVLGSTVGTFILACLALRRRSEKGAIWLAALLFAIAWWGLTNLIEMIWPSESGKILIAQSEYLGVISIPLLVLAFTLEYTGNSNWLRRRVVVPVLIIPILTLIVIWTNSWHHLFNSRAYLVPAYGYEILWIEHGWWFWLFSGYSYLLLLVAVGLLVNTLLYSTAPYRLQLWIMLVGTLVPWVGNLMTILKIGPFKGLDLTPVAFSISGAAAYMALLRLRLLTIPPIARRIVLENMLDGMLVLNKDNLILDLNPAMMRWIGRMPEEVIGHSLFDILPELAARRIAERTYSSTTLEIETNFRMASQIMEARFSLIYDAKNAVIGRVLMLRDITQRKMAERSLWQTNELLEGMFNNTNLLVVYLDRDLKVLRANRAFIEMSGYTADTLISEKPFDLFPLAGREAVFRNVLEGGEIYSATADPCEQPMRSGGQTTFWNWSVQPVVSILGEVEGLVLTLVDVTEREMANRALADALELNQHIIFASTMGIMAFNALGDCLLVNQSAASILELEPGINSDTGGADIDQIPQINLHSILGWETSGLIDRAETVLSTGKPFEGAFHFATGRGRDCWLECYLTPFTSAGQTNLLMLLHDITNVRKAGDELRRSEVRFHTLVESMNDLVFTLDLQGRYQEIFGRAFDLLGIDRDEFQGRTAEEYMGPELGKLHTWANQQVLLGEPVIYIWRVEGKTGEHYYQISLSPIVDEGQLMGAVGVGREISDMKRLEQDLEEAKTLLEQAFSQSPAPMVLLRSPDGIIEVMNSACEIGLKIPDPAALIGMPISKANLNWEVRDADGGLLPREKWPLSVALGGGTINNAEYQILFNDGSIGWVIINATPIRNAAGTQIAALLVFVDITERKIMERSEREQRMLAEAFRDTAAILNSTIQMDTVLTLVLTNIERVVPHDAAHVVLFNEEGEVNRERNRGYLNDEQPIALGLSLRALSAPEWADKPERLPAIILADVTRETTWAEETSFKRLRAFLMVPVRFKDQMVGLITLASTTPDFFDMIHASRLRVFADQAAIAIENARLYAEVQHLTLTDELTRIYNYRGLVELGQREFDRAQRFERPLSALFFDIDNFREFNNRYSHAVGNQVLQALAKVVHGCLRGVDLFARFGGEEFVAMLPETGLESAMQVAERLRQEVEETYVLTRYGRLNITISVGVAELTEEIHTLAGLIDRANQAEHRAKLEGRNQVSAQPVDRNKYQEDSFSN